MRITEEQRKLASDLALMAERAHRLHLHVTGHALHRAVRAVGYEMAGEIEEAGRAALAST